MKKEDIPKVLEKMKEKYFPHLQYSFDGFYFKNSPEIAIKSGNQGISFNEKHFGIRVDQIERVLAHELQHVQDSVESGWNENGQSDYVYAFIFHPSFQNLYKRLEEYYKKKSEEGVQMALEFLPLPGNCFERSKLKNNYASPYEVLARLRGYEHYLNQIKEGVDVETLPYESIEAFKEEDIKFLSVEYRKELAFELKRERPEIFEREENGEITIELSDLSEPDIS